MKYFYGLSLFLFFVSYVSTIKMGNECGKLTLQVCSNVSDHCVNRTEILEMNATSSGNIHRFSGIGHYHFDQRIFYNESVIVTSVNSVVTCVHCRVSICDDVDFMGYCVHFAEGLSIPRTQFDGILQATPVLSVRCSCNNNLLNQNATQIHDDGMQFDRNYVGVVYSPYDKYWEALGPNGTLTRVAWKDYSPLEILTGLQIIQTKFSNIATFGMGTPSNYSEWCEGDKIGFVPKIAAEINSELCYPGLRVSVGIFRKDDVNLQWNSKELFNAIEAAKVANAVENGTVWGITVTSDYVSDSVKARDAIEMIRQVKEINTKENLHLKIGIRLGKCMQFIANRRPEDDAEMPVYTLKNVSADYVPLTAFQSSLHEIANLTDYILCTSFIPSNFAQLPLSKILNITQDQFLSLRKALGKVNPKLRLIIETGVPSQGIGNGFHNTLENLQKYWLSMAEFAKRERIMFHMFEAVDQPWKNVQQSEEDADKNDNEQRFDINGPNGADAHFGWWKRQNNSLPLVYIEKITEARNVELELNNGTLSDNVTENVGNNFKQNEDGMQMPMLLKIVFVIFTAFILVTVVSIAYLWKNLRKAKRQVIKSAYIEQFRTGGGNSFDLTESNYAVALRIPYDKRYELSKDSFDIDKATVMGSGQSGVVIKGAIHGRPGPVAFKCTTSSSTVFDVKSIMSEIKILSYIGEHENVVCILGAHTRKIERGIVYVALEYCELGSLEKFLREIDPTSLEASPSTECLSYVTVGAVRRHENGVQGVENQGYVHSLDVPASTGIQVRPGYVSPEELATFTAPKENTAEDFRVRGVQIGTFLRWSYQIASGMEYVSSKNVVHADLATRNVLLSSIDQVKISDFGLSRKMYQEMGSVLHEQDTPLPWRWMAPESLKNLVFSSESDVWSFGVTIWEILSLGEVPYHGVSYDMKFTIQLDQGMRLPSPKFNTYTIYDQLKKCWEITPGRRPSFTELKEYFMSFC